MSGLLVHEWIERSGGAEQVLDALARVFPDAGIRCLWNDAPGRFGDRPVQHSWLARRPPRRHKALALPLMPSTWRSLRVREPVEWMLVSSHLFAHHARLPAVDVPKFVYAHTPARYIWTPELDGRGDSSLVRMVAPALRSLDRARAQEATSIAANSEFVRQRIAHTWERDATVIHPPVAVERILARADWREAVTDAAELTVLEGLPDPYVLGASRFVPYKQLDRVILAAASAGLPAVIAGRGPEEERLRRVAEAASAAVTFVISPSDELLFSLMQRASVFVFPPVEDFGIVPVEAQAAGTPVVTGPVGGQLETFTDGVSGVVAASTDPSDLAGAIERAISLPAFDPRAQVASFSEVAFAERIREFVDVSCRH